MTMIHPATAVQMGVDMLEDSDTADYVVIRDYDCGGWFKEKITKANKDKYFKYTLSYNKHTLVTENGVEEVHTYPWVEKFKSQDMLYSRKQDLQNGNIRLNENISRYSDFVEGKL
jgi:hypothetical protein